MVEVMQEDLERAEVWRWAKFDPLLENPKDDAQIDVDVLAEAFARHRIAAEQRGKLEGARLAIEAAAEVAESYVVGKPCHHRTDHAKPKIQSLSRLGTSSAIRALSPAKIVGEG